MHVSIVVAQIGLALTRLQCNFLFLNKTHLDTMLLCHDRNLTFRHSNRANHSVEDHAYGLGQLVWIVWYALIIYHTTQDVHMLQQAQ